MRPLSLRTKLTLSYTAILVLLLGAAGAISYKTLARQLDADATDEVEELTRGMHGYLRFVGGEPMLSYDRNDPDQVAFVERATRYYQAFDADTGQMIYQSPALLPLGLQYTPDEVRVFREQPQTMDVYTNEGRIRLTNTLISPPAGDRYLLQVGLRLEHFDAALGRFLALLLWSLAPALAIAIVAGRYMAGRALAPLARLSAEARTIEVADLTRRLTVHGAGDELDELAIAFNDTLARLEHAVGDMKQFSTALAHELRTPLAALRGEAELALTHARSVEDYRRGLATQLEEMDRLARLITELLTLARAEAGDIVLRKQVVDLGALAQSVAQSLEPVARSRELSLLCEAGDQILVTGDAGWLERLLLNLVDNAIAFTPPGGRISIRVTAADGGARLDVEDTGIGMSDVAVAKAFDRFYQADPSRSARGGGVGLGLSLARWIAQRHDASISVQSKPGRGSTFTVLLPI
ncbi:MAG TPA: ATP-binding protein [Vicinamibacterales bacterium]|nr:ATP-binding protein [Vicinamibacterales bacterium]